MCFPPSVHLDCEARVYLVPFWMLTLNLLLLHRCRCETPRAKAFQGDVSSIAATSNSCAPWLPRTSGRYKEIFHSLQRRIYIRMNRFMHVLSWYAPWLVPGIVITALEKTNSLCCHLEVLPLCFVDLFIILKNIKLFFLDSETHSKHSYFFFTDSLWQTTKYPMR